MLKRLTNLLQRARMTNWKEKVVVITGASSGIGEGTAIHFAKKGAKLFLTGRSEDNLQKTIDQCTQTGLPNESIGSGIGDINKSDFRTKLLADVLAKFGRIDILVNNAGMVHYLETINTSEEEYDEMFETNMKSHFMLTKAALEHLKQTKGNIVNISSICGNRPMGGVTVYCMSKAAMDMFTQCLALEMAPHGVRVNAVNPGTIVSNIARRGPRGYKDDEVYKKFLEAQAAKHPLGRVGVPEDVAAAVSFLASDEASFISGQILFVDGARHCISAGVSTDVKK